jgi:hypothetical protein
VGVFPNPGQLANWRQQFTRVSIQDNKNNKLIPKSYLVATRMRKDTHPAGTDSILYAEDPPETGNLVPEAMANLRRRVIAQHYAGILEKLAMPRYASALLDASTVPDEFTVRAGVWRCLVPPWEWKTFVGGFLPFYGTEEYSWWRWMHRRFDLEWSPNLMAPQVTFFGLEADIFKKILTVVRQGLGAADQIREMDIGVQQRRPENMTVLRDGTLLAPMHYFALEDVIRV